MKVQYMISWTIYVMDYPTRLNVTPLYRKGEAELSIRSAGKWDIDNRKNNNYGDYYYEQHIMAHGQIDFERGNIEQRLSIIS